ncbi:MAG: GNAT family N-acetyltransferase [Myxococcales bacterium]|nr:GNAT family N-acetyltransferase [Myxococcales bacterium]
MLIRGITKADFDAIVSAMDAWWGGPSALKPEPFLFYELGHHALVAEDDGAMTGFLLGFVTDRDPRVAYVHLVGIDPERRRRGVAKALYEEFARRAREQGATRLKAITTVGNEGSVDFHRALGFSVEHDTNYAGNGRARYVFTRAL